MVNAETPIHEYTHLWATAIRERNPKERKNVVELMKGTDVWDEVVRRYPELKTDDEIADEVLAQYSGRRGAERLRQEMDDVLKSNSGITEKAAAVMAINNVRAALNRFWRSFARMLGLRYNSMHIISEPEIRKEGHKEHSNFKGYHHYVGKIKDNEAVYYVRFTVQEINTRKKDFVPNQLHSTFISDIEITSANTRVNTGKNPATTNISTFVDAKLQNFLETASKSNNNSSKVVDENGEPLVAFHSGVQNINIFSREYDKKGIGRQLIQDSRQRATTKESTWL